MSPRACALASIVLAACTSTGPSTAPDPSDGASASAAPTTAPTTPPTTPPTTAPTTPPTMAPTTAASAESPKTYALVVSFWSPGDGTDHAASEKLTAIVAKLPKKIAQVSGYWGREGEHDECFTLAELDAKEKAAFLADVKKNVGSSKKVTIKENEACQSR